MEIATATAPQTTLPKLQLVRNAWLVNLLAAVTLITSAIFVGYLRMQAEAEVFVLIGVAGSAYLVFQGWSFLICTRALRQEEKFLSPYLALVVSLLLFNAFILGIALSSSLSIHPLREGLYPTALPVIIPVCSITILIMLPILRALGTRGPSLSERRRTLLHFGIPFLLFVLLLPVPLFVYIAQFVSPDEKVSDSLYSLWRSVLPATPEFVANASAKIVNGTRFYPRVLSSGCPSLEVLTAEAMPGRHPMQAFSGLRIKNPEAAVASALRNIRMERKTTAPMPADERYAVCSVLMKHCDSDELKKLLTDPRVSSDCRDMILSGYFHKYGSLPRETLFEMAMNGDLKMGVMVLAELSRAGLDAEVEQKWPVWILEADAHRATRFAELFRFTTMSPRKKLLEKCLAEGSETMTIAVLRSLYPFGKRSTIDEVFESLLIHLEKTDASSEKRTIRIETYLAMHRVKGDAYPNLATDENSISTYIEATRRRLDLLKNSASQLAPSE